MVKKWGLEYEVVEGWGKLPKGWVFTQVAGIGIDSKDRVYVLCRGEHPVIIFEEDGDFITSFGEGVFTNAHGVFLDSKDNLYCVDNGDHTVRKFNPDGELLFTLGTKDKPAEDGKPFNKPTDIAIAPNGEMYISDGYGNSRVHRYSKDGRLIQSWGEAGTGPGQFNLPHGIWVSRDDRVFVADRQNNRVQIFSRDGIYIDQWKELGRPCDVYMDPFERVYIAELNTRVSILDIEGKVLKRIGGEKSHAAGQFIAPHCSWTDSKGSLYVGEVLEGQRIQKFVPK